MRKTNFAIKPLILAALSAACAFAPACKEQTPEEAEAAIRKEVDGVATTAKRLVFESKQGSAITLVDSGIKKYGERPELCEAMALAYETLGNGELSGTYYLKAASASKNPEHFLKAAKQFEKAQSWASASEALEGYLALEPKSAEVWRELAADYERQNLFEKALNARFSAVKASGEIPSVGEAAAIGSLYVKIENFAQAKDWLEGAKKNFKDASNEQKADILSNLIAVYIAEKDMPALCEAFGELKSLNSELLAKRYPELENQIDEYRSKMKEAQDALKREAETKARLEAERRQKEEAEAKELAEAAAKAKAGADAKNAAEEAKKAEEEAAKILEAKLREQEEALSPEERDAKLVNKKMAENDFDGAERVAQKMVERDQKSAFAWRVLAQVYAAQNRDKDAYVAARECVRLEPDSVNNELLYLSRAAKVLNREDLLDALYLSKEKFPRNPEIALGLARVYVGSQNYNEARYNYKLFFQYADKNHPLLDAARSEFDAIKEDAK